MCTNADDAEVIPFGIRQMTTIDALPLLRPHVQVHYEGGIDKLGKNVTRKNSHESMSLI